LKDPALLYPLYLLLFTMPGVPSVYYGSEWGIGGVKGEWSDVPMRPTLELGHMLGHAPEPDLMKAISRLAAIRKKSKALRNGIYRPLKVRHQQLSFIRDCGEDKVIVLLNSRP
jgi:glycosidase